MSDPCPLQVFQICPQIGRFSVNAADELIKPAVLRGLPKAGVGRGSASGMAAEAVIAGLRREEPRLRRVGGAAISRALDSLVQEGRVCEAAEGRFARVAPMYKHGPAV